MPRQLSFGIGHGTAREFEPVPGIAEAAGAFARSQGRTYDVKGLDTLQVNPRVGFAMQKAYRQGEDNPRMSRGLQRSYEALRDETNTQYEHLTRPEAEGGMGIRVEVSDVDPYDSPRSLANDVRTNKRIKVLSTAATGGHHFFTDEENDRFRAVHDTFGHLALGRGFSRHGEEAAFQSHVQMFSPRARRALASETRGQNSYVNYGPTGDFPDQTQGAVGLPSWAGRRAPMQSRQFQRFVNRGVPSSSPQGEQLSMFPRTTF